MTPVYSPSNAAEAHMILAVLQNQGVYAEIFGEDLQGGIGGLPAFGLLRVMVDEQDFDQARAIIKDWERTPVEIEAPITDSRNSKRRHYSARILLILFIWPFLLMVPILLFFLIKDSVMGVWRLWVG